MEKKELINLLEQYKSDSENLDLINLIAIWYSENLEMIQDNEDYLFFEKAYKLKKTVKTTNNFASHLFYECYENQQALEVQKECITLKPKSYLPYLFYATTLIEQKEYIKAIDALETSQNKHETWDAEHNLWYCKYMIWDYKSAEKHFLKTSQDKERDNELKSMFWLALVQYKLDNKENTYEILRLMQESKNFDNAINDYDIWILYFLYDDYENAKNNTLKCGMRIDLLDRKELWYSIFISDKQLFLKKINKDIKELQGYIQEIKNSTGIWKDAPDEEKNEDMSKFLTEIMEKENMEKLFETKPIVNIDKHLVAEYSWCSIFGCCRHGNPENDY